MAKLQDQDTMDYRDCCASSLAYFRVVFRSAPSENELEKPRRATGFF